MNRLTQLLADWESGNSAFDRGALAKALSSEPSVEPHARECLYRWLLLGPAKRQAPASFASFVGTAPAASGSEALAADINATLARIPGDKPPGFEEEARGVVEYLCVKTGARYDRVMCDQLCPLLQCCLDAHRHRVAELGADEAPATPSLSTAFNLLLQMRQGTFPAAINLRSFREVLSLVFGLLLQYHDPALSLHVERNKLRLVDTIVDAWLPSLYATTAATPRAALALWDAFIIARERDESFVALVGVALVIQARGALLAAATPDAVAQAVAAIRIDEDAVAELLQCTRRVLQATPFSARRQLRLYVLTQIDAATLSTVGDEVARLREFVVLPVDADELTDAFACAVEGVVEPRPQHLNFVVLDCRAEASFHHARLPTAVHVGNYIGFDPELLQRMVAEFESARGSHLCVLGTGRGMVEELNLLKVIGLTFVQAGYKHISFAEGGFKACVPRIKAGRAEVVRTPSQRAAAPSETSTAAAGSPMADRDRSASAAGTDGDAGTTRQQQLAEEAKERLRVAQTKAAEGFAVAKTWGMGLMSRWKKTESQPAAGDSAATAAGPSAPAEPAQAASPVRASAGGGDAAGASPLPTPPPQRAVSKSSAEALFGLDEDDDDDFGLVSTVNGPSSAGDTKAVEAASAPAPAAAADDDDDTEEPAAAPAPGPAQPSPVIEPTPAAAESSQQAAAESSDAKAEEAPAPASAASAPVANDDAQPVKEEEAQPKPAETKPDLGFLDDPFGDFEGAPAETKAEEPAPESAKPAAKPAKKAAAKPAAKPAAAAAPHPFDDIFT